MNSFYLLLAILLSCTLFTPVLADDSITPNSRSGIYFGAGGFHALEDFEGGRGSVFDNAPGFNLRLGYRIHPRIAVEAMVDRINSFDANFSFGGGGFGRATAKSEINTWTGTLNGKFFLFTGRFQPYSLLGIGVLHAQSTQKFNTPLLGTNRSFKSNRIGLAFRYGAGIDTYFTENWVGNLEASYVHSITNEIDGINYFALGGGIQYRF